jgi:hypothetical protein
VEDENMSGRALMLAAVAAAATMLIAGSTLAAETAKEGTYSGKISFAGKITKKVPLGENDRSFTQAFEMEGTSSSDPPVKSRCLGVAQVIDGVLEEHGDCVDTDKDGDQILWKTTEEPRHYYTPIIAITEEAVAGTGKFSGRSATQTLNCGYSTLGEDESVFGWDCDVHGKYKLP